MQLFCLRPYKTGYTGFIEDGDEYAYFQFPRKGALRKLLRFPKNEFHGYRHFIGGISKFIPYLFFLEYPIPFDPVTIEELDRIHKEIGAPIGTSASR
jgi:hypothetical protein